MCRVNLVCFRMSRLHPKYVLCRVFAHSQPKVVPLFSLIVGTFTTRAPPPRPTNITTLSTPSMDTGGTLYK